MKFSSYFGFNADRRKFGAEIAARNAVSFGFTGAEIFSDGDDFGDFDRLKNAVNDYGLSVPCYSVYADLFAESEEQNRRIDGLFREIERAAELGSPYFHHTVCPALFLSPDMPPFAEVLKAVFPAVLKVAKRCQQCGITPLYEPQGVYFNGRGLVDFYDKIRREVKVGLIADFGNPMFVGDKITSLLAPLLGEIRHAHIKDYALGAIPIAGVQSYNIGGGKFLSECEPLTGDAEVKQMFSLMKAADYRGYYSFEFAAGKEKTAELMKSF